MTPDGLDSQTFQELLGLARSGSIDRELAQLKREYHELRPGAPTPPAASEEQRCTLCGASRIVDENGRPGACSLVPGRDGKGGCPDPLHDVRKEQPPAASDEEWAREIVAELDKTEPDQGGRVMATVKFDANGQITIRLNAEG